MNKFSLGVFLDVFTNDKIELQSKIDFIKSIPNLGHIEILLEVDIPPETINWLNEQLSGYQIIVHGPFMCLGFISVHDQINQTSLDIYKKSIDKSINLQAKLITIHAGKHPFYLDSQQVIELFSKNFNELVNYANNQIILTIENMPRKSDAQVHFPLLDGLDNIAQIITNINYTIDIGHCLENGEDYYKFIQENKNRIKNIHLHNAIKNGKSHFGLQLPGGLDTKKFVNFLNEIDYQGFLTLEVLTNEDKVKSIKLIQN